MFNPWSLEFALSVLGLCFILAISTVFLVDLIKKEHWKHRLAFASAGFLIIGFLYGLAVLVGSHNDDELRGIMGWLLFVTFFMMFGVLCVAVVLKIEWDDRHRCGPKSWTL